MTRIRKQLQCGKEQGLSDKQVRGNETASTVYIASAVPLVLVQRLNGSRQLFELCRLRLCGDEVAKGERPQREALRRRSALRGAAKTAEVAYLALRAPQRLGIRAVPLQELAHGQHGGVPAGLLEVGARQALSARGEVVYREVGRGGRVFQYLCAAAVSIIQTRSLREGDAPGAGSSRVARGWAGRRHSASACVAGWPRQCLPDGSSRRGRGCARCRP